MRILASVLLLLVGASAYAQTMTYGQTTGSSAQNNNQNYFIGEYFVTGPSTYTPVSCSAVLAYSSTPAGYHLDCGLYTYAGGKLGSPLCHGSYTATAQVNAGTLTIPLSGCGTLAANTPYWVVTNNDSAEFVGEFSTCGSSCTGAIGTSTYPDWYVSEPYGTYGSNLALTQDVNRIGLYVTVSTNATNAPVIFGQQTIYY